MSGKGGALPGFLVGFAGGLAGISLALRGRSTVVVRELGFLSELARQMTEALAGLAIEEVRRRSARRRPGGPSLLPDEEVTTRVREEWERLGLVARIVDVTTVDGVVYLRGRENDPVRADTLVAVARFLPGVRDVADEIRRGPTGASPEPAAGQAEG